MASPVAAAAAGGAGSPAAGGAAARLAPSGKILPRSGWRGCSSGSKGSMLRSQPAVVSASTLLRPREVAEFSVRYAPERRRQSPPPRWDFNRDGTLNYFGYGASRRYGNTADSGRKPLESSGDESLFVDEAELLNAEEWFVQMSHFGPARRQLREARAAKKVRDLLQSILLDVSDIRIAAKKECEYQSQQKESRTDKCHKNIGNYVGSETERRAPVEQQFQHLGPPDRGRWKL